MRRAERAGFHVIPTGVDHGTVTVIVDGALFEVTTLRADVETDGRHATVAFGRDFSVDAARRDFTINALYADRYGVVTDYVGGLADLAERRVRFIGDADTRIREDYLRILRLFRFHATYGVGALDSQALAACIRQREGLSLLSRERVRAELMKLMVAPSADAMVQAMDEAGFLERIFAGVVNRARFRALAQSDAPALKLAALAVECGEDASRLRERLALSNQETDLLSRIAKVSEALRAAAFQPGELLMKELVYRLDGVAPALTAWLAAAGAAEEIVAAARRIADWTPPRPPWRGADAIAAGVAPGPAVGDWLARAEALWIARDFPDSERDLEAIWRDTAPADAAGFSS